MLASPGDEDADVLGKNDILCIRSALPPPVTSEIFGPVLVLIHLQAPQEQDTGLTRLGAYYVFVE